MPVYCQQAASALRQIKAKGEPCLWATTVAAAADPDKPWLQPAGTPQSYANTPIVFLPMARYAMELIRYLKGTEVVAGSTYGLMANNGFVPKLTDTVTRLDGSILTPYAIDPLAPNGEVIPYTVEFRL